MPTLYELTESFRNIEALLDDETIPAEDLYDAIDAISNDIVEKCMNTARYIKNKEAEIVAVKSEIARLTDRVKYADRSIERMKKYMLETMQQLDNPKIQDALFTISLRLNPPKVIITDEKAIPPLYLVPKPPEISKTLIKKAIEAGNEVPGATLEREQSVQIR